MRSFWDTSLRNVFWLGFFVAILMAWWMMYSMATTMNLDLFGRPISDSQMMPTLSSETGMGSDGGMGAEMEMSGDMSSGKGMSGGMMMDMPMTRFVPLFGMWALMMAAMMLPTLVPTLRAYDDLITSANGSRAGWLGVLAGYAVVWVGFAALITAVQLGLLFGGIVDMLGIAQSWLVTGGLLIVVGVFQFTRVKEICHGVCHSPMSYFLGQWRTGAIGGFRMGVGLGAFCVGCCWGFMALGFVGGVMSLLWMGLATLFMVIEKLPQIGHHVTRPMGGILIFGGMGVLVWPLVMGG